MSVSSVEEFLNCEAGKVKKEVKKRKEKWKQTRIVTEEAQNILSTIKFKEDSNRSM